MHVRLLQLLRKASLIRVCAVCRASYTFLTYTYYRLENSTPLLWDIYNMHWSISEQYLGWSDGAMVLGKLPVPGHPTNLDNSGARAYCACSRCRRALFGHFFSHVSLSLLVLPLFGRRPDIDWNIVSKGR